MKTMDELLIKLKQDGYDMKVQRSQLKAYRVAVKTSNNLTLGYLHRETARHLAEKRRDELSGALWMLNSMKMVKADEVGAILKNLEKEGQADGFSERKTGHGQHEPGSFPSKEVSEHRYGI